MPPSSMMARTVGIYAIVGLMIALLWLARAIPGEIWQLRRGFRSSLRWWQWPLAFLSIVACWPWFLRVWMRVWDVRGILSVGTKSVLFGVHAFWLHPLLIALGWWKAYGMRRVVIGSRADHRNQPGSAIRITRYTTTHLLDPRLWLAFIVHDLGYLGKPNMDGPEGETHPELGAKIMRRLFGDAWGDLVLLHSRYYAKKLNRPVSALCLADKWVIVLEPSWLYLPRVWASGELAEYLANAYERASTAAPDFYPADERAGFLSRDPLRWHRAVKSYMRRWLEEHSDGRADTWTRQRHTSAAVS